MVGNYAIAVQIKPAANQMQPFAMQMKPFAKQIRPYANQIKLFALICFYIQIMFIIQLNNTF